MRLPRVLAAALAGAALAAAGAAYQTLFRNPLVSPDILGVSTGAGVGAVLAIFLSLPVAGIQLLAFAAGLATVGLVYAIASLVHGREPVLVLVLAGVVVGSLAGAAISLLKILADPYSVGHRVALLDGGRLVAQGAPHAVLTPERLRAVYGVSVAIERLARGQTVCVPDYGAAR